MLEEAVTQALRRGTRETVGSLQLVRGSTSRHPASFLDSRKVLGRERPRIGAGHHLEMGL